MTVHMKKMAVGVDSIAHLADIQASRLERARRRGEVPALRHITRHRPKRADELVDGGSLYWVIKGFVQVRQAFVGIEGGVDAKGRPSCALVLDPDLARVTFRAHKPFQGWRYLSVGDAPSDAPPAADGGHGMPSEMAAELRALGLL
ncbi:MAG: DUF1489 domain-containing protein [Rhodospirillales bacterium]|jgi:hypothetical protein|nr:DUF1489 domain-containing protein [Rhodospirillales bacterium]